MTRRKVSNPLALAVLTVLYERPMHPYEISSTLRERRKEDSIKLNYGSLYSVVEALHKRGMVVAKETVREGRRPERTVYAITDAGAIEMVDWLSELISTPQQEFTQFEAALSLIGALPPEEAIRLLETRLMTLQMNRRTYEAMTSSISGFPRIFLIEGEFKFALLKAEIAFVHGVLAELRAGTFGGLDIWRRLHELRASDIPLEQIQAALAEEFPAELSWTEGLHAEIEKDIAHDNPD